MTTTREPHRLTFGLVPPPSFLGVEPRVNALVRWIGERAGVHLVRRQASSYDELVKLVRLGQLDVGWLPPLAFARLEGEGHVDALVSMSRGAPDVRTESVSILFVRSASPIQTLEDLRGRSVAWVDPLSTTGYVIPRMRLAMRVASPRRFFGTEGFFGSHAAVARAVSNGIVDVGATFGRFDATGHLAEGPFAEADVPVESVRALATFGSLPPDLIGVRRQLDADTKNALALAFEAASRDPEIAPHVFMLFGAVDFSREVPSGYDLLRLEVDEGVDSGMLPAAAAFLSTRPPPSGR